VPLFQFEIEIRGRIQIEAPDHAAALAAISAALVRVGAAKLQAVRLTVPADGRIDELPAAVAMRPDDSETVIDVDDWLGRGTAPG
jgi:hypothetical protein